jgi:ABC-type sugar transport system permease subunit
LDQNPQAMLSTLLIGATWIGWPLIMLAAAAGLKMIPPDVYDAAAIDGAGRFSRFRSITWPLLLPLLVPAIIIRSIFAFNQFYLFVVMQSPYPLFTLATLSYYIFDISSGGQFAVSAAINVFTVAMLIIFILMFNRWSRASEGVTYA